MITSVQLTCPALIVIAEMIRICGMIKLSQHSLADLREANEARRTNNAIPKNKTGNDPAILVQIFGNIKAALIATNAITISNIFPNLLSNKCICLPIHLKGLQRYLNIIVSRFHSLTARIYNAAFIFPTTLLCGG